jgi:hypothetical protein
MYLAFYGNNYGSIYGKFIRWWTSPLSYKLNGKWKITYSHVEIVFSDGMMFSASSYENKVRFKKHSFTGKAWDRFKLSISKTDEDIIRENCEVRVNKGEKYDYLGLIGFLIFNTVESKERSFCSEVCTTELQEYVPELKDLVPHKTSPNDMAIALKFGVFNK